MTRYYVMTKNCFHIGEANLCLSSGDTVTFEKTKYSNEWKMCYRNKTYSVSSFEYTTVAKLYSRRLPSNELTEVIYG